MQFACGNRTFCTNLSLAHPSLIVARRLRQFTERRNPKNKETMSITITHTRKADATWKGDVKGGYGLVSTESGSLRQTRFSLSNRTGEEGETQTNPEELIAAGVASCFSMALSKVLTEAETIPTQLVVTGNVDFEVEEGIELTKLTLNAEGIVPAADEESFAQAVEKTAQVCPILQTVRAGFKEIVVNSRLR